MNKAVHSTKINLSVPLSKSLSEESGCEKEAKLESSSICLGSSFGYITLNIKIPTFLDTTQHQELTQTEG